MKNSIWLFCLLSILAGCGDAMIITPNPASGTWDSFTAPSDGGNKNAASVQVPFQALADKAGYLETGNTITHANLATTNGGLGKKVFVSDGAAGWYFWAVAIPVGSPDGDRVVTCTAASGGVWVHEDYFASRNKKRAALGPLPGDNFATVTLANKINKAVVDHGYFTHDIGGGPSGGFDFVATGSSPGATLVVTDLGALAIGDIVKFDCPAFAHFQVYTSAGQFEVWPEYSEDGGSTWHKLIAATPLFQLPAASISTMVPASFTHAVGSAGDFQIRIRAITINAGDTIEVECNSWLAWVVRP